MNLNEFKPILKQKSNLWRELEPIPSMPEDFEDWIHAQLDERVARRKPEYYQTVWETNQDGWRDKYGE